MKNNPYISIIIPLYNKEAIVKRSIQSVLNQSFQDFELIIVDDGSTDNSVSIVKTIYDDRVTLIQQSNRGPSAARNTGTRYAKGEWIIFLDADDEMYENALMNFYTYSNKYSNANMFLGEEFCSNGENKHLVMHYIDGYIHNNLKAQANECIGVRAGTAMYKKTLVTNNSFNEKIRRFEDLDFLLKILKVAKVFVFAHPVIICNTEFCSASKGRKNIREDFLGHIDMKGKSFWEQFILYKLFYTQHILYEEQCKKLYPKLYKRYDLKIFCYFILWINHCKIKNLRKWWLKAINIDNIQIS